MSSRIIYLNVYRLCIPSRYVESAYAIPIQLIVDTE